MTDQQSIFVAFEVPHLTRANRDLLKDELTRVTGVGIEGIEDISFPESEVEFAYHALGGTEPRPLYTRIEMTIKGDDERIRWFLADEAADLQRFMFDCLEKIGQEPANIYRLGVEVVEPVESALAAELGGREKAPLEGE